MIKLCNCNLAANSLRIHEFTLNRFHGSCFFLSWLLLLCSLEALVSELIKYIDPGISSLASIADITIA